MNQSKHTPQIKNNPLSSMVLMNYAVQCKDQNSQKTGCFLFDIQKWKETGYFYAISKVYDDLVSFYDSEDGEKRQSIYETREVI